MKRATHRTILLVIGSILALGPAWGKIIGTVGMLMAFNSLGTSTPEPDMLAQHISLALYATVAGLLLCPIGIALIVIAAVKMEK